MNYSIANYGVKILKNTKIRYYEVIITNVIQAVKETYNEIKDLSWISKLENKNISNSYNKRAEITIERIANNFTNPTKLTNSTGEYVVSILSKNVLTNELKYNDIPLGEVLGKRKTGNGGFDYYAENDIERYIVFGEAKFLSNSSAYRDALEQIVRFISEKKDLMDLPDIEKFVSVDSINNFGENEKGYAAGFSQFTNRKNFIDFLDIEHNYPSLLNYKELVLIGVRIDEEKGICV